MRRESTDGSLHNRQQMRVAAPRALVWRQLGLNDGFFATLPVSDVVIAQDERHAKFLARVGIGPIAFKRGGSASITDVSERERLGLVGTLDDGSIELDAKLELADGDEDETLLTYDAELQMPYKMPRLHRMLSAMLDDHVAELLRQVADTASRQWKAERALRPSPRED
jgi:carbon monoxide dehydrogenase subunit G